MCGGFNPFDPVGSGLGLYDSGSGSPLPASPLPGPSIPTLSGTTGVGFPDADTVINTLTGGATNAFGLTNDSSDLSEYIGYLNPVSQAEQGAGYIIQGGDVWVGLDRAVDLPGSRTRKDKDGNIAPQGDVDRGTRDVGKWANDVSGGASGQAMNYIAPVAGGIIGGIYGGPAGAMIGAPIGRVFSDKWNQKTYEDTARDYAIAQAISAATYGVGQGIDALSAPTITPDAAPIVADMAENAARNAAINEGLKASGEGTVAGGVTGAGVPQAASRGLIESLGRTAVNTALSTPIKAAANSLWPAAERQQAPSWTQNSIAEAINMRQGSDGSYSADLDPSMGTSRASLPFGTQSSFMSRLLQSGAGSGSNAPYRRMRGV